MTRERTWRIVAPALAGVGLFGLLATLDYLPPNGSWYGRHPMTSTALSSALLFVAASMLLTGVLRERDAARLDRISSVAYRSLAQYANDAGRALIAPLNGADLYALGLPGASPEDAGRNRDRLVALGFQSSFDETSGSWRRDDPDELDRRLRVLVGDGAFVLELFRTTASVRRRLQEVTALWAPVMLISASQADDLGRLRVLTDALELLQERLRASGLVGIESLAWRPPPVWGDDVSREFWVAVEAYQQIRDDFGDLAQLPSDAIIGRRRSRP